MDKYSRIDMLKTDIERLNLRIRYDTDSYIRLRRMLADLSPRDDASVPQLQLPDHQMPPVVIFKPRSNTNEAILFVILGVIGTVIGTWIGLVYF